VQKLKISRLPWNFLPGDIYQSLCQLLERPSMVSVDISDAQFLCMDDFANFINHARGLTGLSLNLINTVPPHYHKAKSKQGDYKSRFDRNCISHLNRGYGMQGEFCICALAPWTSITFRRMVDLYIATYVSLRLKMAVLTGYFAPSEAHSSTSPLFYHMCVSDHVFD
jgi:hypothetical protein